MCVFFWYKDPKRDFSDITDRKVESSCISLCFKRPKEASCL